MLSFSLLETGHRKAKYMSLRERLGMGVLTGDWRFSALFISSTIQQPSLQFALACLACLEG